MDTTCLLLQLLVTNVHVNNLTKNRHLRKYIKTLCENELVKESLFYCLSANLSKGFQQNVNLSNVLKGNETQVGTLVYFLSPKITSLKVVEETP